MNRIRDKKRWFAVQFGNQITPCAVNGAIPGVAFGPAVIGLVMLILGIIGISAPLSYSGVAGVSVAAAVVGVPAPIVQTVQRRKLFTSNFVQNTTDRWSSPDFPRSLYSKLDLRLAGNLTKTESVAGTLADNAFSLIRGIRIKADGDIVKEFEPSMMRVYSHHILRGIDTDATMITLGSDTAEAFSGRLSVDFGSPRSRLPEASFFPGHRYGELQFEIDWGAYTDLVGGGTYTAPSFSTTPTLEVWGEEILDPNLRSRPFLLHRCFTKTFSRNGTALAGDSFQLPVGEAYKGILLKQMTRTPDLGVSTLIASTANLVVRAQGSYRKVEATWQELVARNKAQYGVALPTGYAYFDFMEDGDFNKVLRTGDGVGITSFEVLADISNLANGILQIMPVTYKAARAA